MSSAHVEIEGPALSPYSAEIYVQDNFFNPVTSGNASIQITDLYTKSIVLISTLMPYVGVDTTGKFGVYRYEVDASIYVRNGSLLHTLIGRDGSGAIQATRQIVWRDDGS